MKGPLTEDATAALPLTLAESFKKNWSLLEEAEKRNEAVLEKLKNFVALSS